MLPGIVEPDGVIVRERRVSAPQKGQALVELLASGVSFAENAMRRGRYPGQPKFPFVLGYDLVGTVTAVGEGVDGDLVGRRVAAVVKTGGWSTHALLDADDLVPVPESLDPAELESILLNGITAWQMVHRKARVRAGQTVLVHGASGVVGIVLVQLARHAGIRVIGTGSPRSHPMLRQLGAEPLDYRDPALVDKVRELAPDGVDAVFDNIGGASFQRSFRQLAPGGTLVGYGVASQLEDSNNMFMTFAGIMSRFAFWSALPNRGRSGDLLQLLGRQDHLPHPVPPPARRRPAQRRGPARAERHQRPRRGQDPAPRRRPLANLFNLSGITNRTPDETELWDTWIVGAPIAGQNVASVLTVAVSDDLDHNGVYDDAPDVVADANHDGRIDDADLDAIGVASNVVTIPFRINGDPA